jgi:hypothetical protein
MRRWVKRLGVGATAGLLAAVVPAVVVPAAVVPAAAGAATSPGWRVTQTYGASVNYPVLQSIAAVNASDAWIAGSNYQSLLVERWTNGKWQALPEPAGFSGTNISVNDQLIAASGPTNAWTFPTISTTTVTQYALEWNGQSWTKFTLKGFQPLDSAVFSSTDAWVFGAKDASNILGYGAPYATQYNGRKWVQAAAPPGVILHVSKLSASDIWGYGPTAKTASGSAGSWSYLAMHWNGKKWLSFGIPKEAAVDKYPWFVSSIVALGDKNVWVSEGVTADQSGEPGPLGVALLHWNGSKWTTVVKNTTVYAPEGLTYDGHGGFWLPAYVSPQTDGYLLHYSDGRLTKQSAPTVAGYEDVPGGLAYIPGTESVWGIAGLTPVGNGISESGILKYGP